ncbi:MAG TPA: APC family permease [Thermoanaerobaculia bacterium]|jgi:amino acid transporter|nr:APC family permease [Thermoanaerobaculia bacterium]
MPKDQTVQETDGGAPGLLRAVSRWQIVALVLNDVIGSGVYLLPAGAAALLGGASVAAVVLAGLAVLLVVLCFAEAASHFDQPGSAYLYAREAFGELIGFEVGWMTWLARVASVASLAVAFAQALGYLWPEARAGWGRDVAIVLPVLALTALNVVGIRSGVRTAVLLAIAKIAPLLVFVAAGTVFALRGGGAAAVGGAVGAAAAGGAVGTAAAGGAAGAAGGAAGWHQVGAAALLLLYAYAGFENTAAAAGEYKNPRRDVPFALLAQIGMVTVLYAWVQWVALATLPGLAASATPLADAARRFLGPWGGWLLTIGATLSILGTNGNTVLTGPRYLFALARGGYGPRLLGSVQPRFRTPAVAVVVQTVIALPLALSGTFTGLAALSVVARLATYVGTAAAVPVLRRKLGSRPGAFRLPGGPLVPTAAVLICIVFAASATPRDLIAGVVALAVGLAVFKLRRRAPGSSLAPGSQ